MRKRKFMLALTATAIMSLGGVIASCGNPTEPPAPTPQVNDQYTTKVTFDENLGSVTLSSTTGEIKADTKVTVTITPKTDVTVKTITINGKAEDRTKTTITFTPKKGENTIDVVFEAKPAPVVPTMTADKEVVELATLNQEDTVTLTIKDVEGVPAWTATDEEVISLTPSADGKSCVIKNLKGGKNVIVSATLGDLNVDITVKASLYGDVRDEYTVYKADGTKIADVKGFYNAVGTCNEDPTGVGNYVTLKGKTEKAYIFDNAFLAGVTKDGTSDEFNTHEKYTDGKFKPWFQNHQLTVDMSSKTTLFNTLAKAENPDGKHDKYNLIDARPIAWGKDLFLDNNEGFNEATIPSKNVWCGFRASSYSAAMTGPRYTSWADPYEWSDIDMTWDLSQSMIVPSYNENQSAFAQIYLGSSTVLKNIVGMYFDAGNMKANETLEDGALRDIFTFTEVLDQSGGLGTGRFGVREIGTTSIGKAKWDKFNKCWTFPEVKINIKCNIRFTGDVGNETGNYFRKYEVSGLKGTTTTATVKYEFDGGQKARVGSSERTTFGASLTPNYKVKELPDLSCGAQWLNLIQDTSIAHQLPGASKEVDDNLQWGAGRTANAGAQTYLQGSDNVTSSHDADGRSIFNFKY